MYDDDHDHVDGMGLRLRTAAANRPIFHPPGDIMPMRNNGGIV
jgi:hypothetical protein